jgi:ferredoxin
MGEDGLANLKNAKEASGEDFELETEDAGCAKEAAEICPVQIIKVEK